DRDAARNLVRNPTDLRDDEHLASFLGTRRERPEVGGPGRHHRELGAAWSLHRRLSAIERGRLWVTGLVATRLRLDRAQLVIDGRLFWRGTRLRRVRRGRHGAAQLRRKVVVD